MREEDEKRLIIAEEQRIVRDGLISLLRNLEGIAMVGEARNGPESVELVGRVRPDLVLMGLSVSGTSWLSAAEQIKKRFPGTKILILTSRDSEDDIRAAFRAGADGYCLRDAGLPELVNALESLLSGKVYFSPAISNKIVNGYLRRNRPSKLHLLTEREKQILKLMTRGQKNREIASFLSISDKTVAKHRSNIMKKLDCHTVADLAALVQNISFT